MTERPTPSSTAASTAHSLPLNSSALGLEGVRRGANFIECEAVVSAGKERADEEGNIPARIGLEYMAQTAALLADQDASGRHCEFRMGSRFIHYEAVSFHVGERITIRADLEFDGARMKIFDCRIADPQSGRILQRGKLNVCLHSGADATVKTN